MNTRQFFLLLFFISSFCNLTATAQRGASALGVRLTPDGAGGTAKIFLDQDFALEGQLNAGGLFGLDGESLTAVGLVEYHFALPDPSWRIFFGGGAHFGVWNNRRFDDDDDFILGIDGIGGVEYFFRKIPLAVSGDLKPAINIFSAFEFFPHNLVGVSARYYFGRGKR